MLKLFLAIGTICMFVLGLFRRKMYQFPIWKVLAATLILTFAGVLGAYTMFFIENGEWGGQSYFGAVLLAPLVLAAAAPALRISIAQMLDFCAPEECIMLAVLKVDCLINGCCAGRFLFRTLDGFDIYFPSQIAECLNAVVVMVILLWLEKRPGNKGCIYPYYLVFYGATRLVLNCFRYEQSAFVWILPAGTFWAIVSIMVGSVILRICRMKKAEIRK